MDGQPVDLRFTKWGGGRHWEFTMERLGTDRWGLWLGGRAGIRLRRGEHFTMAQPNDFVLLVPREGCWAAAWNADPEASPIELYVDVTTRPTVADGVVRAVDLDLDVVRFHDGRTELVDEDEFAAHQVQLDYPAHLIQQARTTASQLVDALSAHTEPFDTVGATWLAAFCDSR